MTDKVKSDRIAFRVSGDLKEKLEKEAEREEKTLSGLMQKIASNYIKEKEEEIAMNEQYRTINSIKLSMQDIMGGYNSIPQDQRERINRYLKSEIGTQRVGDWGFMFQYIPMELLGSEQEEEGKFEVTPAEKALLFTGRLYYAHRVTAGGEEVHVRDGKPYFDKIQQVISVVHPEKKYAFKRLANAANMTDPQNLIIELKYLLDVTEGKYKADYVKFAVMVYKFFNHDIDGLWIDTDDWY